MTYEELKRNTIAYFQSQGFICNDDILTKENIRQHQLIINGQPTIQEEKQTITITIIGEGELSGEILLGFNIKIGRQDAGDFWIKDINDIQSFLNK